MFVCLLGELILGFCYSDFIWETGEFELTLTIALVLQANRLTKCASQPKTTVIIVPTDLVTNLIVSSFCPFLLTKNKDQGFSKVVARNVFCLHRTVIYFNAMLNSIDFYKGIFLYVIPVLL